MYINYATMHPYAFKKGHYYSYGLIQSYVIPLQRELLGVINSFKIE